MSRTHLWYCRSWRVWQAGQQNSHTRRSPERPRMPWWWREWRQWQDKHCDVTSSQLLGEVRWGDEGKGDRGERQPRWQQQCDNRNGVVIMSLLSWDSSDGDGEMKRTRVKWQVRVRETARWRGRGCQEKNESTMAQHTILCTVLSWKCYMSTVA